MLYCIKGNYSAMRCAGGVLKDAGRKNLCFRAFRIKAYIL